MNFTENAYRKHYLFEGTSDYYIHKHQQNIGAASGEGLLQIFQMQLLV